MTRAQYPGQLDEQSRSRASFVSTSTCWLVAGRNEAPGVPIGETED